MLDKIVLVTRHTRLEELIRRFNTRGQARFYIEHSGGDFAEYEREHDTYHRALDRLRKELDLGLPRQQLDRELIPTYSFGTNDLVVTLGQDGLVANTAKYAAGLYLVGVNPDPERFDGVLLSYTVQNALQGVTSAIEQRAAARSVTLAEVTLTDGQRLLAFNDFFLGARTHVSARYQLRVGSACEAQSSSGLLVSTGAGSTGWMSSVFNMAAGVAKFTGGSSGAGIRLGWDDPRLLYAVREPFVSRHSSAGLVAGLLEPETVFTVESRMPSGGVIFSDGMEADYLEFNSGATATVRSAAQRALLVVPGAQ
jgi:hypothetical protein